VPSPAELSQVFLYSWGVAAVSQSAALYTLLALGLGVYEPPINPKLFAWGVVTASVAIPAASASWLAGAEPGAAFFGSLLGLAAGVGVAIMVVDYVPIAGLAASSLAQAGGITLSTRWAAGHGDR